MNSFSNPGQFSPSNLSSMSQQQYDDFMFQLRANYMAMQEAQQRQQQAPAVQRPISNPNQISESDIAWMNEFGAEQEKRPWYNKDERYENIMGKLKAQQAEQEDKIRWGERSSMPSSAGALGTKHIAAPEYLSLANDFENLSKALSRPQFAGHPAIKDVINIAPIKSLRELAKRIGNPMGGGTYPLGSYSQLQKDIQDFRQKMRIHLSRHFKIPMNQTEGWGYPDLAKQILDAYSLLLKGGQ